jgi:hypothetical protein
MIMDYLINKKIYKTRSTVEHANSFVKTGMRLTPFRGLSTLTLGEDWKIYMIKNIVLKRSALEIHYIVD